MTIETGRVIDDVTEMTATNAAVEVGRFERQHLFCQAVIYATFDKDGRCRYVGKSRRGVRPLGIHHCIDTDAEWTTLRIWRVNVRSDEELLDLELDAILHFQPALNSKTSTARRVERRGQVVGASR